MFSKRLIVKIFYVGYLTICLNVSATDKATPPNQEHAFDASMQQTDSKLLIEQLRQKIAAAANEDPAQIFALKLLLGRELFTLAVDGDRVSRDESGKIFSELVTAQPKHPLALAYYGSAKLLEAKRRWIPWEKGELCKKGLKILDEAVMLSENSPANAEIRFVRAISIYPLPNFFGRRKLAQQDLEWLATRLDQEITAGNLTSTIGSTVYYYLGLFHLEYDRTALANAFWEKAYLIAPDSSHGLAAKNRLGKGR
jgi:hypothetical protein